MNRRLLLKRFAAVAVALTVAPAIPAASESDPAADRAERERRAAEQAGHAFPHGAPDLKTDGMTITAGATGGDLDIRIAANTLIDLDESVRSHSSTYTVSFYGGGMWTPAEPSS